MYECEECGAEYATSIEAEDCEAADLQGGSVMATQEELDRAFNRSLATTGVDGTHVKVGLPEHFLGMKSVIGRIKSADPDNDSFEVLVTLSRADFVVDELSD
jgi:hypothetical protein